MMMVEFKVTIQVDIPCINFLLYHAVNTTDSMHNLCTLTVLVNENESVQYGLTLSGK